MEEVLTNSSGNSSGKSSGNRDDKEVGTRRGVDVPIIDDVMSLSEDELEGKIREAKDLFVELNGGEDSSKDEGTNEETKLVLVAKNVSQEMFTDKFGWIKARFLLDDNADLFVRKVGGRCRGSMSFEIIGEASKWLERNNIDDFIEGAVAPHYEFGKHILEPDIAICEILGSQSLPRCIIEIEVNHSSPRQSRELADLYFQHNDVKTVILFKVCGRRVDRTFSAVCVVWTKAQTGEILCMEANDFGTGQINEIARRNLEVENGPRCRVTREYTVPQPGRPLEGRASHWVDIPASTFLVNVTNQGGQTLNLPIDNLQLPLHRIARVIARALR